MEEITTRLLESPGVLVVGHKKTNQAETGLEISFCWLAFMVPEDAMQTAGGIVRSNLESDVDTVCYSTNLPGKMCHLVQLWHGCLGCNQLHSDWICNLRHRTEFMLSAVNLINRLWLGRS